MLILKATQSETTLLKVKQLDLEGNLQSLGSFLAT